jgi:nicotinamidase/pyrazinamidase
MVVCGIATNMFCYFAARDLRAAGFRVLMVEDASAGIDVPAANLYQDQARVEGRRLGIEYIELEALVTR